ncbi:MAG: glycosyltransferase family 4 protein [Pseudolabrys sp.]
MSQPPNPVLLYHPDGYRVKRKDLKGRHSAGESFLTAFLEHAGGPDVYALCLGEQGFDEFGQSVRASGRPLMARAVRRGDVDILRRQALLNLPYPGIADEAKIRSFLGDASYALCGVTHTISSREALDGVAGLLQVPVQPWDAVICTSRAVHDAVSRVLASVENDLRARQGATKFTRPMLPIIPLGVHGKRFTRKDADRAKWRKQLNIADDVTVVLFFGRLSVHAKAAPFQLAQAAELAVAKSKRRLAILWCGWFNDDFQRRVFMETAKSMAPSVPFYHVDGREEAARFSVWAAADIFCSLSDNIQESFGLTVIEALAAGLPVVASNWNGYREAIEDGVNGILVDSYMPSGSLGDAAYRYVSGIDTYDRYIGAASQLCFVDLEQTAAALTRLAGDAALRTRLAEAAGKTVADKFDWKAVMPRYQDLWREQIKKLSHARADKDPSSTSWQMYDPSYVFAGFPSHRLNDDSALLRGPQFDRWSELVKQPGIVVNPGVLAGRAQFQQLHETFADKRAHAVGEVIGSFKPEDAAAVARTLHWLIKVGLLALAANLKRGESSGDL